MKMPKIVTGLCAAAVMLGLAVPASAQLTPYEDYTPSDEVVELTYVKVDEGQLNTYLEGLKETWVAGNEVAMRLGHIKSYGIYEVPYGSNETNLVLRITYPNTDTTGPSKARYDAFMAQWGKERQASSNKTVLEIYNKIRKIKGVYLLRELKMND